MEPPKFFHLKYKFIIFLIFITTIASFYVLYSTPRLIDYKSNIVRAINDDSIFGFRAIHNHSEYFQHDTRYPVCKGSIYGSIMNYGSLWLSRTAWIPLSMIHNSIVIVQVLALPFLFLWVLRRRLSYPQLTIVFILSLSGYECWNSANYIFPYTTYPGAFVLPFVWLGLFLLARQKFWGYFLLSFSGLIHPSIALYAIFMACIFFFVNFKDFRRPEGAYLLIALLITITPQILLLKDVSKIPAADMIRAFQLNMHMTPWNYGKRFIPMLPCVIAFGLLVIMSRAYWNRLGLVYEKLVLSGFIATVLLGVSQILGHVFKIPFFIQLIGLRATSLFVILFLPIIFLFLIDQFSHTDGLLRFLSSFIIFLMVAAPPFGLDKTPIILLALALYLVKKPQLSDVRKRWLRAILIGIAGCWIVIWLLYQRSVVDIYSEGYSSFWNYLKSNIPVDDTAVISLSMKIFVICAAVLTMIWPILSNYYKRFMPSLSRVSTVSVVLFFLFTSWGYSFTLNLSSSHKFRQENTDLYDAEIWANKHTLPDALFIFSEGSWRSFSERPVFNPYPQLEYMYYPNIEAFKIDQFLINLLGVNKAYQTATVGRWFQETTKAYNEKFKTAADFQRLGQLVHAEYLVEKRAFDLPIVYENRTYKIYDLS
ncbi:MAG: hypothetical protein A3G33_07230 [Omnitrophica bacterium RIFCSPLOWO2_12_FULL_44_17]|uniref:Glycosyltransferase RgtA/B/C/D-like domain-containing protein n=1 Tax=Candidatus Danuiimicrobium aquiferis TaxID=1801832 RepID=A0A1G1KYN8_9BACT|nr:MAG: hypothetical protein A3B72_07530 [Omnitrophica bacterium RIFCSPHIGHO2_02_FULL_45_28]OGW90396.1 MAG: hypothetical protein A3E74_07265 [Omnitrophica bacterium RIFCSPHIGHO2_12_FULL_44_12]OGW98018.1 MAG: hypothetical protein A3G33_07230 [Omnitrophica bacterium RIFCSPLOWO2_12_FULL_44_17]OGX03537.1 MAG: hypothetical protein A3J12_03000 [Omnitrophica bacterium RIFCSPLOWO2_02_FULL_44_11]